MKTVHAKRNYISNQQRSNFNGDIEYGPKVAVYPYGYCIITNMNINGKSMSILGQTQQ